MMMFSPCLLTLIIRRRKLYFSVPLFSREFKNYNFGPDREAAFFYHRSK